MGDRDRATAQPRCVWSSAPRPGPGCGSSQGRAGWGNREARARRKLLCALGPATQDDVEWTKPGMRPTLSVSFVISIIFLTDILVNCSTGYVARWATIAICHPRSHAQHLRLQWFWSLHCTGYMHKVSDHQSMVEHSTSSSTEQLGPSRLAPVLPQVHRT